MTQRVSRSWTRRVFVTVCVVSALVVISQEPTAARTFTWTYCNGSNGDADADPYDNLSDTNALNWCLFYYDIVYLEPDNGGGYIGYVIGNSGPFTSGRYWGCYDMDPDPDPEALECYSGVELKSWNMLLPAGSGGKPRLIATDDLRAPMVSTRHSSASYYEIHGIAFDGNRGARPAEDCGVDQIHRGWASNIMLKEGSDVQIIEIESYSALCGSALELNDIDNYTITTSYLGDNGFEEGTSGVGPEPWADGLTLNNTSNGVVYYNQLEDNTDLGAVVKGGETIYVAHNDVWNDDLYAFGGIHIQRCDDGCHTWDNDVWSDEDLMSFGIVLGRHPWPNTGDTGDVGEVYENYVDGAVINLAIDGIEAGVIVDNVLSNPQGSRGFETCTVSANLSVAHKGTATVQSGATESLHWSGGVCSTV